MRSQTGTPPLFIHLHKLKPTAGGFRASDSFLTSSMLEFPEMSIHSTGISMLPLPVDKKKKKSEELLYRDVYI